VFFLGAGASVPAGVPTTVSFVQEFIASLSSDNAAVVRMVTAALGRGSSSPVDVELLLETLDSLSGSLGQVGAVFAPISELMKLPSASYKEIGDDLRRFIRQKALVSANKIDYLRPLLDFQHNSPIDVFSVNYDTSIELLAHYHKRSYTDGFAAEWSPDSLDRNDVDIRLFKLHGSVLWYQSNVAKTYLKVPIDSMADVRLYTGEKTFPLMIYPMRKWQYAEPLMELMVALKRRLEKEKETTLVVVVGYSFRDDYLRDVFWDAFRANRKALMVLVDPRAEQIYQSRLRFYTKDVPSSLSERVICMNGSFERILPDLQLHVVNPAMSAIELVNKAEASQRIGQDSPWSAIITAALNVGFDAPLKKFLPKLEGLNWNEKFNVFARGLLVEAAMGRTPEALIYGEMLAKILEPWLTVPSVDTNRYSEKDSHWTNFNVIFTDPNHSRPNHSQLAMSFAPIISLGQRFLSWKKNEDDGHEQLFKVVDHLLELQKHLLGFEAIQRTRGNLADCFIPGTIFHSEAVAIEKRISEAFKQSDGQSLPAEDLNKAVALLESRWLSHWLSGLKSPV
jgi:hypothetical protein